MNISSATSTDVFVVEVLEGKIPLSAIHPGSTDIERLTAKKEYTFYGSAVANIASGNDEPWAILQDNPAFGISIKRLMEARDKGTVLLKRLDGSEYVP